MEAHSTSRALSLATAALLLLQACGADAPAAPPVIDELTVFIDANNNCSLESKSVECAGVSGEIRTRYPTSKPRIDICLAKETRFEAAVEVMRSVSDAGFTVGKFACPTQPAAG